MLTSRLSELGVGFLVIFSDIPRFLKRYLEYRHSRRNFLIKKRAVKNMNLFDGKG